MPMTSAARLIAVFALAAWLTGCGVNTIPTYEEQAKAAWSQVLNQYQRRADLIPNLVETVQGYARQEQEVLTSVVEARARATQMTIRKTSSPIRRRSSVSRRRRGKLVRRCRG
jgi:LemA protein